MCIVHSSHIKTAALAVMTFSLRKVDGENTNTGLAEVNGELIHKNSPDWVYDHFIPTLKETDLDTGLTQKSQWSDMVEMGCLNSQNEFDMRAMLIDDIIEKDMDSEQIKTLMEAYRSAYENAEFTSYNQPYELVPTAENAESFSITNIADIIQSSDLLELRPEILKYYQNEGQFTEADINTLVDILLATNVENPKAEYFKELKIVINSANERGIVDDNGNMLLDWQVEGLKVEVHDKFVEYDFIPKDMETGAEEGIMKLSEITNHTSGMIHKSETEQIVEQVTDDSNVLMHGWEIVLLGVGIILLVCFILMWGCKTRGWLCFKKDNDEFHTKEFEKRDDGQYPAADVMQIRERRLLSTRCKQNPVLSGMLSEIHESPDLPSPEIGITNTETFIEQTAETVRVESMVGALVLLLGATGLIIYLSRKLRGKRSELQLSIAK